jgi:transcriptional regulator with XRE-family HTH domain
MVKKPNPIDIAVGARVKMERALRRVSQTELANHLGITFQQVQKYERGVNRISASKMMMIASFFGVSPSSLFENSGVQQNATQGASTAAKGSDIAEFISSQEGLALNRAFLKIKDPSLRRHIVGLVMAASRADDSDQESAPQAQRSSDMHG